MKLSEIVKRFFISVKRIFPARTVIFSREIALPLVIFIICSTFGCNKSAENIENAGVSAADGQPVEKFVMPKELKSFAKELSAISVSSAENPASIKLSPLTFSTKDEAPGTIGWGKINRVVMEAGKYIVLDLSDCTAQDNVISGIAVIADGRYDSDSNDMNIIRSNPYITGIILPSTLNIIGEMAFSHCSNLTSVIIPDSTAVIGEEAFYACKKLTDITIPSGVTEIGKDAFWECDNLLSVTFESGNIDIAEIKYTNNGFKELRELYYYEGAGTYARIKGSEYWDIHGRENIFERADAVFTSYEELEECLAGLDAGNPWRPTLVKLSPLTFSTRAVTDGNIGWGEINQIVMEAEKYVIMDISDCTAQNDKIDGDGRYRTPYRHSMNSTIKKNPYIKGIILPNTLKIIGEYAFDECYNLTGIIIPDGVTSIENYAFSGCTRLSNTVIPDSVTVIGDRAFVHCRRFTGINIPEGITVIGYYVFDGCSGLTSINFPKSVTTIMESAFAGCVNLTTISIPDTVTVIEQHAFQNCSGLTNIDLPGSVTTIEEFTFEGCINLTNITIPSSVTTIGESAFKGCNSLINITIPSSVISIGEEVFRGCSSLADITVDAANTVYASEAGVLFNKDKTALLQYPAKGAAEYTIPKTVTVIGTYSFAYCDSLTNITIPAGVISIGVAAFYKCNNLANIIIPEGITSIGKAAFYDSGLTGINIPNSVVSIGEAAFSNCGNLTSITIPNGITSIEKDTFSYCLNLTGIVIPEGVTSIGESAFYKCDNLANIIIPEGITSIGKAAFSDSGLTGINIPNSVISIEESAFYKCNKLVSITIPETVISIGKSAFSNCYDLVNITIPKGVTSIGESAFYDCNNLINITVDADNTAYASEDGVLFNKDKTTLIYYPMRKAGGYTIPDTVTTIGNSAFAKAYLNEIIIPNSVTVIESNAFYNCGALNNITIPESVQYIGTKAFAQMLSLTRIIMPAGVESEDDTFLSAYELEKFYDNFSRANEYTNLYWVYEYAGRTAGTYIRDSEDGSWAKRYFTTGETYIAKDNLRLRSSADISSDAVKMITRHEPVIVLEEGREETIDDITSAWVKVRLNDKTEGWCFGGYIE